MRIARSSALRRRSEDFLDAERTASRVFVAGSRNAWEYWEENL